MLKKAVQHGRSERRSEAHFVSYVEPLSEARAPLADFFSILLGWSFPGRVKWMVIDQVLMRSEVVGFNGEVVLIERFRTGRGAEVRTIRFSFFLCGEPAQPIFRHPG